MKSNRKDPPAERKGLASIPTAPAQETGLSLPPADAVVALRIVGADLPEIPLSLLKRTFLLGSDPDDPDVTVRVSSRMNDPAAREHVSRVHLMIQRKGNRLWIKDQDSTNGTFIKDRQEADGDIAAGESFRVGNVALLAMDEQMVLLRPQLAWVLGFKAHAQVDEMLQLVASGEPLLLIGEPGCEQRWLAEQIHCTSARRHAGFVAVSPPLTEQALAGATGGTAFLDLAGADRVPAPFVKELFGDTYRVRPILAAPDLETAAEHLGHQNAHKLRPIAIPAVRTRRDDVPRILNSLFRREPLSSKRDVADLGEPAVESLKAFHWPGNFDDLRRNAPRILALVECGGNKRAAARMLGIKHQSLSDALARIGL